jgi:hypothetical protein
VYVAVNVGVCFIGCVYWKLVYVAVNVVVCFIGCVYWKLVYVAVNVGVCLIGPCTGNYFGILRETNNR